MRSEGRGIERTRTNLEDIRSYVMLGTMVAVMITMWVTIILAISLSK